MTTETTSRLSPEEVLTAVKRFFLGDDPVHHAWLESETNRSLTFGTFRGNLAVAVVGREGDGTRVRITTLRYDGAVPRLVTFLRGLEPESVNGGKAASEAPQLDPLMSDRDRG